MNREVLAGAEARDAFPFLGLEVEPAVRLNAADEAALDAADIVEVAIDDGEGTGRSEVAGEDRLALPHLLVDDPLRMLDAGTFRARADPRPSARHRSQLKGVACAGHGEALSHEVRVLTWSARTEHGCANAVRSGDSAHGLAGDRIGEGQEPLGATDAVDEGDPEVRRCLDAAMDGQASTVLDDSRFRPGISFGVEQR